MATNLDTSLFEGIENEALSPARNPKLGAGEYVVEVLSTTLHTSEAPGRKGTKYGIIEARVLSAGPGSLSPEGAVGTITMNSQKPTFLKDVKSAMLALANVPSDKIADEAKKINAERAATFFSQDPKVQSSLKGKKMRVVLTEAVAKGSGNKYMKKAFGPAN